MPAWAEAFLNAGNPFFYPSIFGLILIAGLGAPVNADSVILVVGYLVYRGSAAVPPALVAVISGILVSDTLMFFIARRFGLRLTQVWPFRKILTPDRIQRAQSSYQKHGYRIIFTARFMPGIRTVFVFTSGLLGLRYWKFIACDAAGAVIVAPITLLSVSWVAGNTDRILEILGRSQGVILGMVAFFLGRYFYRRATSRKSSTSELKASAGTESGPSYPQG